MSRITVSDVSQFLDKMTLEICRLENIRDAAIDVVRAFHFGELDKDKINMLEKSLEENSNA